MSIAIVNGWKLLLSANMIEQVAGLVETVEKARSKNREGYKKKASTKRLAAILKLVFQTIPDDPTLPAFRHGGTLGDAFKHWYRAKFYQQYRLFFRYSQAEKVIVYGWVNDEETLRAYESDTDAHKTFKKMLQSGNPPDDWEQLATSCEDEEVGRRLQRIMDSIRDLELA